MKRIILASQSPRRRELLTQIGLKFEVIPSTMEEVITSINPVEVVQELAQQKARDVANVAAKETPKESGDKEDAVRMLTMLQGKEHSVYTGVALLTGEQEIIFAEETRVQMCPMTPEEIAWYVNTGEPMDKAGAYGIQGLCARFVRQIQGDYNNVVGLPVGRIYQELKKEEGVF